MQIIEFVVDAVYILGIVALLAELFVRKSNRMRPLIALLGFLTLPFLVVSYTDLRPTYMMMVRDAIIRIISTNQVFSNFSIRLNQSDILSLLLDSPFNNYLPDTLYKIGMLLYATLITLVIMMTSATSSFLQTIWKLITGKS